MSSETTHKYRVYQGDCLEILQQLQKESVDLVITSPPYEDVAGAGYNGATKDILFFKLYSEFLDKWFDEVFRVLKKNGQVFLNLKSKTHKTTLRTPHWIEFLESFKKFQLKSYIIWKYAGSFDSTKKRFHLDYEIIYHLSKGNNITLNEDCGIHDALSGVWYIPHNISERVHPTQMPEALVERILEVSSKDGDVVLDTFLGSGTTMKVCIEKGLSCIGIEINPKHIETTKKRCFSQSLIPINYEVLTV